MIYNIQSYFLSLVWFFLVASVLFSGCNTNKRQQEVNESTVLKLGKWRGTLQAKDAQIPFQFEVEQSGGDFTIYLNNASERIPIDEIKISGDSIHMPMYIFDATIRAKIDGDKLKGVWVKNYTDDYRVPFEASYGDCTRFVLTSSNPPLSFEGKWEVDFVSDGKTEKAIGLFHQNGSRLTGTFLTPTGDYRFLEGVADGDSMKLSCFDGTHAYLFKARLDPRGVLSGEFWAGKSWYQPWTAKRNDAYELPDPYSLAYVKDKSKSFALALPNTNGELVQLSDAKYKDKVVVVQVMGTWCPNCMDETRFFANWKKSNSGKDVEFIGLAFEMKDDKDYAISRINKMKEKLGVDYPILFAGTTSKSDKEEALPMLSEIKSFPTTIILDKQHKVRKIHTGFSGPGTGAYYDKYVEEFDLIIEKLLAE